MLATIHGAVPFYEGVHFYYGAAAVAFVLAVLKILGKLIKPNWDGYQAFRVFWGGRPAVDGVSPEVLSGPLRLKRVEDLQKEQVIITKNLDAGQAAIIERLDNHDEKVQSIDTRVQAIDDKLEEVITNVRKLVRNGNNSNDPGDMVYRIGERMGLLVDEPIERDRRIDDKKA